MLLLLLLAAPLIKWISTALLPTQGRDTPAFCPQPQRRERKCVSEREGWRDGGGGVQEVDAGRRGRNMTIYEQTFMKQDGEHARGGPAALARISLGCLTNATNVYTSSYAHKHTKVHTQARECMQCQSNRKRNVTIY